MQAPEVVEREWGREIRYAVNGRYAGKILEVRAGHALGPEDGRHGRESLYFRKGSGKLVLGERVLAIEPGLAVTVEAGAPYRIEAATDLEVLKLSALEPGEEPGGGGAGEEARCPGGSSGSMTSAASTARP